MMISVHCVRWGGAGKLWGMHHNCLMPPCLMPSGGTLQEGSSQSSGRRAPPQQEPTTMNSGVILDHFKRFARFAMGSVQSNIRLSWGRPVNLAYLANGKGRDRRVINQACLIRTAMFGACGQGHERRNITQSIPVLTCLL